MHKNVKGKYSLTATIVVRVNIVMYAQAHCTMDSCLYNIHTKEVRGSKTLAICLSSLYQQAKSKVPD
jgi:hypothetical protein